jgi:hypothetical protein
MASVPLALKRIRLAGKLNDHTRVQCPACRDHLFLHQPDEERPDRLLGTCDECRAWFLIDAAEKVMVRLPDEEELRAF